IRGTALRLGALQARRTSGDFAMADALGVARGALRIALDTVDVAGVRLRGAELAAVLRDPGAARVRLTATSATGPALLASADVRADSLALTTTLDTLDITAGDDRWTLAIPATVRRDSLGLTLDSLDARGVRGGRVTAGGTAPVQGGIDVRARADALPLAFLGLVGQVRLPLDGAASFALHGTGTREAPVFDFDGALDGARFGEVRLARLLANAGYAERRLRTRLSLQQGDSVLLRGAATLPVDLALAPRPYRVLDEPLTGSVRSERVDLSAIESFTTLVREARGTFLLNVDLGGTIAHPQLRGDLQVESGAARLPALGGVLVSDVRADVRFDGDSLLVRRLDAATRENGNRGRLSLTGAMGFANWRAPVFDLALVATDFHAIDEPRVAVLDVSTDPALRLTGPFGAATLTGGIRVERGTIYLPGLTRKRVIDLDDPEFYNVVDTTLSMNRTLLPAAPSALVRGLTLRNVGVELNDEVWLRGPEANINLGGRLNLTTTRPSQLGLEADRPRLALDGVLHATRGTYRLNLNVVQRTFEIEQGELRFFGDTELNPALDIHAVHTVRPYDPNAARQDVRIRAVITGTLAQPKLALESADNLALSESDLLSYLVTGGPSFAAGGRSDDLVAARLALSSLGSYLGSRASGGFFDVVQFQTSGVDEQAFEGAGSAGAAILSGTRLGLGVQISDRAFVTADAGLCQFGNVVGGQGFNASDFAYSIGVKVDYRLSGALSLSAGVEPSTSQRFCRADQGARGFAPTPRQFTFDLVRTWRF
ncbi:MAG TPA: translocation/assembly module TamB domain-containing protein, partial [Gemmatimonadaceae bacterium]|nr:translocation/assembly module TamB domain-containing protein [Gemmatimonadaceae bacterium]